MPIREITLLYNPLVAILSSGTGTRPAWQIEDELAGLFSVTEKERAIRHKSGQSVWTNDVAHALSQLVKKGKIKQVEKRKAPNGGQRGVYTVK